MPTTCGCRLRTVWRPAAMCTSPTASSLGGPPATASSARCPPRPRLLIQTPHSRPVSPARVPRTRRPCPRLVLRTPWPLPLLMPPAAAVRPAGRAPCLCSSPVRTLVQTGSVHSSPKTASTSPWSTTTFATGGGRATTFFATPFSTSYSIEYDKDTTSPSSPHLHAAHSASPASSTLPPKATARTKALALYVIASTHSDYPIST